LDVHFLSFWTQKEEKTEPKERKTVNLAREISQGRAPEPPRKHELFLKNWNL